MKKLLILFVCICFSFMFAFSQNVGIGTNTPSSKLEIRNSLKSDIKIRSNSFADTSVLMFSNRLSSGEGTDYIFSSNQEQGLFISSASDLPQNSNSNTMVITPQGRIGLGGVPLASSILDISSTSRGILIPRMTTAERTAIASPVMGLLVFDNSTQSFWFRNGSAWREIVNSPSGALNEIRDADNDTKVQTEKTADDDTIRFVSKGFEIARFTSKTLHMDTAGSVYIGNFAGQLDGGIDNLGNPFTGNVAIGRWAGQNSVNGSNNVFVGYAAGRYELGKWNTYVGYNAGNGTLIGTNFANTFIGRFAGGSASGDENIHIGTYAGAYNTGNDNIFIGNGSGGGSFVGSDNGSNNVVIGHNAGPMNINTSSNNILIGNNVAQTDVHNHRLYIHNAASDSTTALIFGKFDSAYLRVNGDLKVKNELHTPVRTGFSNMVPICYGNVSSAGTINIGASTSNFTVTKGSAGFYAITITGESYQFQSYVTIVTPINSVTPHIATTGSGAGQLQINIHDLTGAGADGGFHFVVYKE
jgi:hypothetical protein